MVLLGWIVKPFRLERSEKMNAVHVSDGEHFSFKLKIL